MLNSKPLTFVFALLVVGCETRQEDNPPVGQVAERPVEQEAAPSAGTEHFTAVDVAESLRADGVPLTYPITDVGPEPNFPSQKPVPGLLSRAVTASDSVDVRIEVFDSPTARASEQERRDQNLENAKANMEPGVLPEFMATADCGPILVELMQLTDSGIGREQYRQVVDILRNRYGPC